MSEEVSDIDIELHKISFGFTPDLIKEESKKLNIEFETFKAESFKDKDEYTIEEEFELYKSYVGHKLAVLQTTMAYIIRMTKPGILQE